MGTILPSFPIETDEKYLPSIILNSGYARSIREFEVIGAQIIGERAGAFIFLTEDGAIDPQKLFHWIIGKDVYVCEEHRGLFDVIFKYLPPACLKSLAEIGTCFYKDLVINVYSNDGMVSIRRGNKWGHLSNVFKLFPIAKTPKQVQLAVDLAMVRMWNYGFFDISFRSVGTTVQEIYRRKISYQPRPPVEHMQMHLESFRAARMEGVVFGTSNVYDYDIVAAFPSHISALYTTQNMKWSSGTKYIPSATYAAALCDVHINERLVRGPLAVRAGRDDIYFPVGTVPNVWLNKPDLDLFYEYPQLGEILTIHKASWGISEVEARPFNRVMRTLYGIRERDEFLASYIKLVMAAFWGKFINSYVQITNPITGEGHLQASSLYNPVFASHVTATMRAQLYRRSMHKPVIGEFIDGLASTKPLSVAARGFGQIMLKGTGEMTLFNDYRKSAQWKNPELREMAREQRDKYSIRREFQYAETLKSAVQKYGETEAWHHIGKMVSAIDTIRLGSSIRFMGAEKLRVGHYLENTVSSYPPLINELTLFRMLRKPEWKDTQTSSV